MAYRPARPSPPPPHAHYSRNGLPSDPSLAMAVPLKVLSVQTVKQTVATCSDSPFLAGPPPPPSKPTSKLTSSALNSHHKDQHLVGYCSNSSECSARSNSGTRPALYGEAGVGGFGSWSRCGVATTPRGSPSHRVSSNPSRPHSAIVSRGAPMALRSPSTGRPEEVIRLVACAAEEEVVDDCESSITGEVQEQEAAPRPFVTHQGDLFFQATGDCALSSSVPICSTSSVDAPPTYVNKYRKYVQSYRKQNEYLPENIGGVDHIAEGGEVEKPTNAANRHRGGDKGHSHRGRSTTVKDYAGGPSLQSKRAWLSERQEKHIRRAARRRSGREVSRNSSSSSVSSTSSSSS